MTRPDGRTSLAGYTSRDIARPCYVSKPSWKTTFSEHQEKFQTTRISIYWKWYLGQRSTGFLEILWDLYKVYYYYKANEIKILKFAPYEFQVIRRTLESIERLQVRLSAEQLSNGIRFEFPSWWSFCFYRIQEFALNVLFGRWIDMVSRISFSEKVPVVQQAVLAMKIVIPYID